MNGKKAPNKTGEDVFLFITQSMDLYQWEQVSRQSDLHLKITVIREIQVHLNGYGCTAWVIYNENMDYLHCNDLNWDGKKSCK